MLEREDGTHPEDAAAAGVLPYGIAPRGYRLPAAARPGAVRLQVSDLGRSLAFYREVLGLHPLERVGGAATLAAPSGGETLVELRERPGARPVPAGGRLGLYHFALLVPDRAALGRLLAHCGKLGVPVGTADHAVSEAVYLADPDGLGIEVYADRPRAAWRRRGRELHITTEPLELRSVVGASGGAAWDGMPAGTRVGHVHLSVGDLDRASAFYHEGLGLDKVVWSYPGALFLSAGGYHHHLGTNVWSAGARPAGDGDARLLEWRLVLPSGEDVAAAARSLAVGGAPGREHGRGWLVDDPWGTTLRLVAAAA